MAISVVQTLAIVSVDTTTSTTVTGTFTAGNAVVVAVSQWRGAAAPSMTGVVDQTHGNAAFTHDVTGTKGSTGGTGDGWGWDVFSLFNVSGGSTTLLVTAAVTEYMDVLTWEIAGLGTSNSYDAPVHTSAVGANNALTTQTVTASAAEAQAAEIVLSVCSTYHNDVQPSTSTTGYTPNDYSAAYNGVHGAGGYAGAHKITGSIETPSVVWTFTADQPVAEIWAYKGTGGPAFIAAPRKPTLQAVNRAATR